MTEIVTFPNIPPVAAGIARPRWSVMIPTYNCAHYLRQTLESVLAQDPGPEQMQIEVVDDQSTKDDPETVVREVGQGRVSFYQHPKNIGAIANFNSCLQRSIGEWVHLLHGDDFVLPGFYPKIEAAIQQHPEVGLVFTRSFVVDADGEIDWLTVRLPTYEQSSSDPTPLLDGNLLCTPSVVVRREAYESLGGYAPWLSHTADWEMWVRVIAARGGTSVNEALTCYRSFAGNDSTRLVQAGGYLRHILDTVEVFDKLYPSFDIGRARRRLADLAFAAGASKVSSATPASIQADEQFRRDLSLQLDWKYRVRLRARRIQQWLRS